ncbi:hypothetical protein Droror1_Dr00020108 [Drosera rotundifolia]
MSPGKLLHFFLEWCQPLLRDSSMCMRRKYFPKGYTGLLRFLQTPFYVKQHKSLAKVRKEPPRQHEQIDMLFLLLEVRNIVSHDVGDDYFDGGSGKCNVGDDGVVFFD